MSLFTHHHTIRSLVDRKLNISPLDKTQNLEDTKSFPLGFPQSTMAVEEHLKKGQQVTRQDALVSSHQLLPPREPPVTKLETYRFIVWSLMIIVLQVWRDIQSFCLYRAMLASDAITHYFVSGSPLSISSILRSKLTSADSIFQSDDRTQGSWCRAHTLE